MSVVNKRMDECLSCDQWFPRIPAHPAWEWAHCPECRNILGVLWALAFVSPVEVRRATKADAV